MAAHWTEHGGRQIPDLVSGLVTWRAVSVQVRLDSYSEFETLRTGTHRVRLKGIRGKVGQSVNVWHRSPTECLHRVIVEAQDDKDGHIGGVVVACEDDT